MTGLSRISVSLFIILSLSLISVYSLRYLPLREINTVVVSGSEKTYMMSCMLSPLAGRGYFQIRRNSLTENLESLPYIEKAYAGYDGGKLTLNIIPVSAGLILKSKSDAYFLHGNTLSSLNIRDLEALSRMYLSLELGEGYLSYLIKYGFDDDFSNVSSALMNLNAYHNLIDKAEYDNNKSTGKGELILQMDPLKARLRTSGTVDSRKLDAALGVIKAEQWKDGQFLSSVIDYELRSGQLIRLKG